MNLDKETIRKIRGLIVFTIVVLMIIWNYKVFFGLLGYVLNIILPFLIGGAIAFVLNVPMHFIEEKLFGNKTAKSSKFLQRIARPISLVMTILFLFGIVFLVVFIVAPELANTVASLGKTIQTFIPEVQSWAEDIFHNNKEILGWIQSMEFDWDKMIAGGIDFFKTGAGSVLDSTFAVAKSIFHNNKEILGWIQSMEFDWDKMIAGGIDFFKTGAGSVLDSTFAVAKSIVSGAATFAIAFIFACYILLQKL